MIDFARITVEAGDGGNGAGSFHRIKGKRYGKADGGDGGDGGDVYLEASASLNTLEPFRYIKDYRAQKGASGLSQRRRGAQGEDLVVKVPVGTQVKVSSLELDGNEARIVRSKAVTLANEKRQTLNETPNNSSNSTGQAGIVIDERLTVYDLTEDGQRVLMVRGGRGGRGNVHLRDEFGRRPRQGEKGGSGEVKSLTLELKLIADVGLIGLPNAGKSTLLSALTSARPKIASYPFTTLEPNLGVLEVKCQRGYGNEARIVRSKAVTLKDEKRQTLNETPNNSSNSTGQAGIVTDERLTNFERIILADIPGLIEGASQGRGLGDLFLRHIERTKILVHLVSLEKMSDGNGNEARIVRSKAVTLANEKRQTLNETPNNSSNSTGQAGIVTDERLTNLWQDYQTVRKELKTYSKELVKKKEIIALTKIDLVGKEKIDQVLKFFASKRKKVVAVSSVSSQGLDLLVREILKIV